jgi:uroporphyrinogen-III synthase
MSLPLVVLRPEPGLGETVSRVRALGLDVVAAPLFEIEPVAWQAPDVGRFDAIAAGSANSFRYGGDGLQSLKVLPLHAVGERTAEAARAAGFDVASVGDTVLQDVIDGLDPPLRLLRLAGENRVSLRAPEGMGIVELVLYRAEPLPLAPEATESLQAGAVALLHSGEAGRHFAAECDRLAIDRSRVGIAALAPRIAEAVGEGWRAVKAAVAPNDAALLVIAVDMCHTMARQGAKPRGPRNGT